MLSPFRADGKPFATADTRRYPYVMSWNEIAVWAHKHNNATNGVLRDNMRAGFEGLRYLIPRKCSFGTARLDKRGIGLGQVKGTSEEDRGIEKVHRTISANGDDLSKW